MSQTPVRMKSSRTLKIMVPSRNLSRARSRGRAGPEDCAVQVEARIRGQLRMPRDERGELGMAAHERRVREQRRVETEDRADFRRMNAEERFELVGYDRIRDSRLGGGRSRHRLGGAARFRSSSPERRPARSPGRRPARGAGG